jgi:hypothetical protein
VLHVTLPRSVTSVHQIEITSRCSLKCVYCPSPRIVRGDYADKGRVAGDMTRENYVRALEWVAHYVGQGTQTELNLAGIGESTIHPEFLAYLRLAREAVGPKGTIIFATNGIFHDGRIHTDDFVKEMARYRPIVCISLHKPEKAGRVLPLYKKHGIFGGISTDPTTFANDWAGQLDWPCDESMACQWLREGKIFVLSDGRLSTCCLDAQGLGTIGHVSDPIGSVRTKPYALCHSCFQIAGIAGFDQYGKGLE